MPKTKYPGQFDTSVEIPIVRDNIVEIGSDVLNSLRSAVFQIERVLGINPQGAVGNTVADRLNSIVDGNGNILKEALDKANLLSGPIIDSDVSKVAAIKESKLRLDYPTQLLQDEISILNTQIDEIIDQITEISAVLTAHINPNAINRHPATAISISSASPSAKDDAAMSLQVGDVQSSFEYIYNHHIFYSGKDISIDNRSHNANQIFFDNSDVSAYISEDDVQGALEEVTLLIPQQIIEHQDLFHSSGMLRFGMIVQPSLSDVGNTLVDSKGIGYPMVTSNQNKTTRVTFNDSEEFVYKPQVSDLLKITNGEDSSVYEISKVTLSSGGGLDSVHIFGGEDSDATESSVGSVYADPRRFTNISGLMATTREFALLTSAEVIKISNPNAVSVVTSEIKPSEITSINRFFNLKIDQTLTLKIDTFSADAERQSIDTIVSRINESAAENAWPITAYRIDIENENSELSIVYNVADEDGVRHTFEISGEEDVITALGFENIEDQVIYSQYGSKYYINGQAHMGLKELLNSSGHTFFTGARTIYRANSTINFKELGIRNGYVVTISGTNDDGSYVITEVQEGSLTIDSGQLPSGFTSDSGDSAKMVVYEDIVSLETLTFDEVDDSYGSMVVDVFLNEDKDLHVAVRATYEAQIVGVKSAYSVVDLSGDLQDNDYNVSFKEEDPDGSPWLSISINGGEKVRLSGKNSYVYVTSGTDHSTFKFHIEDIDYILAKMLTDGSADTVIHCKRPPNYDRNLLIARIPYGNFKGRVIGGQYEFPRILSKLEHGNIGYNEISDGARNLLIERPLSELRSNGVVLDTEVVSVTINSDGYYVISVNRGIVYVVGERFEVDSHDVITDIFAAHVDKFFIAVDEYGNIVFDPADAYCTSAMEDSEVCMLATVEYDGVTINIIDLRLFIDKLDFTVVNHISVSPQPSMGHFTDIGKAIQYAKRFSEMFPLAGVPTVHLKSGVHKVIIDTGLDVADASISGIYNAYIDAGFYIDFPLNLTGEGDSSVLDIHNVFNDWDSSVSYELKILDGLDPVGRVNASWAKGAILIMGPGDRVGIKGDGYLRDGVCRISNLKLDTSYIHIISPRQWVSPAPDGTPATKYNSRIEIDRVHFDLGRSSFDESYSYGIMCSQFDDDMDAKYGNMSITNCIFNHAFIYHHGINTCWHSISLINNYVNSDFPGGSFLVDSTTSSIAFNDPGEAHSMPCDNNIYIASNTSAFGTGNTIDKDQDVMWGDFSAKNLTVCGDFKASGDITAGDVLTAGSISLTQPYTRRQIISFDRDSNIATEAGGFFNDVHYLTEAGSLPGSYTAATRILTQPWPGHIELRNPTVPVLAFHDAESLGVVKFDLRPGETLKKITIFGTTDSFSYAGSAMWSGLGVIVWETTAIGTQQHYPASADPSNFSDFAFSSHGFSGGDPECGYGTGLMGYSITTDDDLGTITGGGNFTPSVWHMAIASSSGTADVAPNNSYYPASFVHKYIHFIVVETTSSSFGDLYQGTYYV